MRKATQLHSGKVPIPGYKLLRLIGRGGFGEVWEAQAADGNPIALKFLYCDSAETAALEIRAIQLVQKLDHPNLTRIGQVWSVRGYVVVAMELAEGSLHDMLLAYEEEFGTPIPVKEVLTYLAQVAEGIDFLNTRQHLLNGQRVAIQHCDIKPSNILLFGETAKLCDYGLASLTTSTVKAHRRAGSLPFAAPEVFQGRLSDRTDQYALAVTYCQLRGGRLPFTDSPGNFRVQYTRPAPELTMLSPPERPIIFRALAPVPHDRFPSCSEMIAQLTKVQS